jgi:hypothetical protein
MFVRIFDESAMPWNAGGGGGGMRWDTEWGEKGTDSEKFETLIKILLVVGLEGGCPSL